MEQLPADQPLEQIEYTRELMVIKMKIQRGVMEGFVGKGASNELKNEWINQYSDEFRKLFVQKIREDVTFVHWATENNEEAVEEFVGILKAKNLP